MQSAVERYYSINKTFLTKMGLWPRQSRFLRVLLPTIVFSCIISIGILEFVRLTETWRDISTACESIIIIVLVLGANAKLLTIVFNKRSLLIDVFPGCPLNTLLCPMRTWIVEIEATNPTDIACYVGNCLPPVPQMQQLFSLIEYHWCLFTHSAEVEILQDYAIIGRKITITYAVGVYTLMCLYLLVPLTPQILDLVKPLNNSRPYKYMFDVYYGFDREEYYYMILFHSYIVSVMATSCMVVVDTLYITFAQHGCSLFAAIGHRLGNITSRLSENQKDNSIFVDNMRSGEDDEIYRELIHCLHKHQLCIEYVKLVDSLFSVYSLSLSFMNVMATSLLGVQVIVLWNRKDEMIRYASMSIGGFVHLFALNFPGEMIINHSSDIFHKAYNAKWYKLSRKTKQLLSIFFYKSLMPCTLTAGKIIVLSMANYASVIQMSMSYFTTLSSFK